MCPLSGERVWDQGALECDERAVISDETLAITLGGGIPRPIAYLNLERLSEPYVNNALGLPQHYARGASERRRIEQEAVV
jgi:hypothetical protein